MTLEEFQRSLNARELLRHIQGQVRGELGPRAEQVAKAHSSGPFKMIDLRRMGHPYRRGGPNFLDPSVINVQRGKFRAGWRVVYGDLRGAKAELLVIKNDSDVADFMFGTTRMIQRPVWERIEDDLRGPFATAILHAVEAYWR